MGRPSDLAVASSRALVGDCIVQRIAVEFDYWINDGSWLCWDQMNLRNITSVTYRVASAGLGGRIEIHQDSTTGAAIGTPANIPVTGDWQTWQDVQVPVTDPGGTHKLCFIFERNPNDKLLFNLNWIDFNGSGVSRPR